ncbi:hypothetical protein HYC85_004058 [Camellia sinensis]|uniref:Aldehyde oxidase/xanthine dehydrogenase a/b hammerhead domain-containing protein n=1 Tax=Camellia sinensis TaxID=4442 RepID=A0A7J7HVE8_CAMSI|nr:hypothetical protein HYC85_004058 [Camellia sinensis]
MQGRCTWRDGGVSEIFNSKFLLQIFPLGKSPFTESVSLSHLSAVQSFHRPSVIGSQNYDIIKQGTAVGSPEVHLSARLQAKYTDDTPMPPAGLHGALILSQKPHARILAINDSGAKSSPGFAGFFFSKDVPGDNMIGPVIFDEELFATEFVTCVGQIFSEEWKGCHSTAFYTVLEVTDPFSKT